MRIPAMEASGIIQPVRLLFTACSMSCLFGIAPSHGATPVSFPDPKLEALIREAAGVPSGTIYDTDVALLTELDGDSSGIADLSGLEHCVNLTRLILPSNQIEDLSPVAGLTSLTMLVLRDNQVASISPLAGLVNLTWLELNGNEIADISPLAGLTHLVYHALGDNQIVDIGALAGMTDLQYLSLKNNRVADVTALSGLTQLSALILDSNRIADISPLSANTGLGTNDNILLRDNPLDFPAVTVHIPQLQSRGANVLYNAVALASIDPDRAAQNSVVEITELHGAHFNTGLLVDLRRAGELGIPGTAVDVVSSESLSCTFDLTGAAIGLWDVYVWNPNDHYGWLVEGFEVTGPASAKRWHLYDCRRGRSGGVGKARKTGTGNSFQVGQSWRARTRSLK